MPKKKPAKGKPRAAAAKKPKRRAAAPRKRPAEPPTAPAWDAVRLSTGETLGAAAKAKPVLLVFLRHSG